MTFYHFRVLTLLLIRVLFSRPFFEFFNTSNQYSNLFTVSNLTYKKLLLQINLEQQHGGKYYTNRQVNGGEHIMNYSGTSPYRHLHNTDTFPLRTVHLVPETENSMQSLYPCKGRFTRYNFVACDMLTTSLRQESFRVNQTYNLLAIIVYDTKNVVGF